MRPRAGWAMRADRLALLPCLIVALGSGCDLSYRQFRERLVSRACDRQVRCGQVGAKDRGHCALPPLPHFGDVELDLEYELEHHRLQFHPDNAARCLAAWEHLPCDAAQAQADLWRACHGLVTAAASTDGTCWADGECTGGVCVGEEEGCAGRCVAFASPGDACQPLGSPPAQSCDPTVQFCDGVCRPKGARGAACTADDQCLFAYVCVAARCAPPPRLEAGAACGPEAPPCRDGLFCGTDETCAPRVASGGTCTDGGCLDGLVCLEGACHPWLDVGDACSSAAGCPASQSCEGGRCQSSPAPLGLGQPCQNDAECAAPLFCANGSCTYRRGRFGPCVSDSGCLPGLTCDLAAQRCRSPVNCEEMPSARRSR